MFGRGLLKLVVLLWACALAATSLLAEESSTLDLPGIIARGTLRVAAHYQDVPSFLMTVPGAEGQAEHLDGIDAELARLLAVELGLTLVMNRDAKTFDEVVEIVSRGEADVAISSLSDTLNRAKLVLFTQPYISLKQSILINRLRAAQYKVGSDPLIVLSQPKIPLGVIRGTSYVEFAKKDYPEATLEEYDEWDQLIQDLEKGRLLALLYDEVEITAFHRKNPDAALSLQTFVRRDREDTLAFAVNSKATHFHSWLNLFIAKLRGEGTLEKLRKRFLSPE